MNELTTSNDVLAVARQTDTMLHLAAQLVRSGLIPKSVGSPEAALGVLLKGRELGLAPMQSFDSIDVIQGKPTLKPQAMLALIYASPSCELVEIGFSDASKAMVTMQRRGSPPHTESFTMEDAKALGLASKDNWKKQPSTMLKWRAIAACARVVFPDVIQGMYTPEEISPGTVEVLDVTDTPEWEEIPSASEPAPPTLSREKAADLHRALGGMGFSGAQQTALAGMVGRNVSSFTELSIDESKAVFAAGQTISEGAATPKDYGIREWPE